MVLQIQRTILKIWHIPFTLLFVFVVIPFLWITIKFRKVQARPSVVFGSSPIINSKYHSLALQQTGIQSKTVVRGWYQDIHRPDDFDVIFGTIDASLPFWRRFYVLFIENYVIFAQVLWKYNIFFYYFNGFYLRHNGMLRWVEIPVLRFLGKKVIVMNYGADITIPSNTHDVLRKYVTGRQYPRMLLEERNTKRQIMQFTHFADAIIGCGALGADYLTRIDFPCSSHLCIDDKKWTAHYGPPRLLGEPMRVLHAPNHRHIKGTQFLLQAIERLQKEGLNIELVILERVQNEEVRRQMAQCHVVADQFIIGWYGLNSIEGMASGKPVLCYLRKDTMQLYTYFSFAGACPIVNTPIEQIEENLRKLFHSPEMCEELGRSGRVYVKKYHSLETMGGFLKGIIEQVWYGIEFDAEAYWKKQQIIRD